MQALRQVVLAHLDVEERVARRLAMAAGQAVTASARAGQGSQKARGVDSLGRCRRCRCCSRRCRLGHAGRGIWRSCGRPQKAPWIEIERGPTCWSPEEELVQWRRRGARGGKGKCAEGALQCPEVGRAPGTEVSGCTLAGHSPRRARRRRRAGHAPRGGARWRREGRSVPALCGGGSTRAAGRFDVSRSPHIQQPLLGKRGSARKVVVVVGFFFFYLSSGGKNE